MLENEIFNKFTKHLKFTLRTAGILARLEKKDLIGPIHLLRGIIKQPGSLAAEILHKNGLKETPLIFDDKQTAEKTITLDLNPSAQSIITKMLNIAFEYHHQYIGTEHLLMALLKMPDQEIINLLEKKNLSLQQIRNNLTAVLNATSHFSDITEIFSDLLQDLQTDNRRMVNPPTGNNNMMIETLTTDLTDPKVQKNIDPVIGRQQEIERLIQILARRHKNNPLLLGDPGVGKTAIVEGLAKRITNQEVPEILLNKKILHLDLGLMVAGTMYRGEFESRLKNILAQIKNDPNLIIFIDELHNIVGAGSTSGGTMDAANLLKPALARGEIRCIGATTQTEYHKYIESDPALARRFQVIQIEEPSPAEAKQILLGLKNYYEKFHQVTISPESLTAAVDLSVRYLPDKFLPDKALDLLDEAASRIKLRQPANPLRKKLHNAKLAMAELEKKKNQFILAEQYEEALKIKNQEKIWQQKISVWQTELSEKHNSLPTITSDDIATVVSQITKIPLAYLQATSDSRLTNLPKKLTKRIIGQNEIIEKIVNVVRRSQAGLANLDRPIGSFLFLGPSGVGKTELAKVLAQEYFGSNQSLIRIDMSEFNESFNISKLLGAPAGYVGYRESGQLSAEVKKHPYAVILFDEIEKAHPDIFNILLQILDEGYLTDGEGQKINFQHTIVILTSNIASEKFGALGAFGFTSANDESASRSSKIKEKVQAELEEHFRPELLNRLDTVAIFNPLQLSDLKKIVKLQLKELNQRLEDKGITLKITPQAVNHLAKISDQSNKGAREIRRNIQNLIEQQLTDFLFQRQSQPKNILVKYTENKITLSADQTRK